jgi:hypothetical protein
MFEENKELFSETTIIIEGFQCQEAYIKVKKIVDKAIEFRIS